MTLTKRQQRSLRAWCNDSNLSTAVEWVLDGTVEPEEVSHEVLITLAEWLASEVA